MNNKRLFVITICYLTLSGWGFYAHEQINQYAIYTLDPEVILFFKKNLPYLKKHASDPDKRRYVNDKEAAKHYLDVENYEQHIDSIPRRFADALSKYGEEKLNQNGIVPWQIYNSYLNLVSAFKEKDNQRILKSAVDLAHYIGDAHVPLHTTHNHNGQLTNQHGIHGFWESRLPELFWNDYNLIVGKAYYITNPLTEAWNIVNTSHKLVDTVLTMQKQLDANINLDEKFEFSKRKGTLQKQYSTVYSKRYQSMTNNSVERRLRASVHAIGSFWYTAWINSGQPKLLNDTNKKRALRPLQKHQNTRLRLLLFG